MVCMLKNLTSTYTEDDFKTLLVGNDLLHDLPRLIVLLHPEHEDVENPADYFLVLCRGLWICYLVSVAAQGRSHVNHP